MKKEAALIAHNNTHSTSRIFRNVALIRLHDDVSDRVKNRLKAIEDACYECRQQVDDMYKLIVSTPSIGSDMNVTKLSKEVYPDNPAYDGDELIHPNTNDELQEGFINGYNKARETLYTKEDILKAIDFGYTNTQGDGNEIKEREEIFIKSLKQPKH